MKAKQMIERIITNNKWLATFVLHRMNELCIEKNALNVVNGYHFFKNIIYIRGHDSCFSTERDSFLRECKVNIAGYKNKIIIASETQVYGNGSQCFFVDGSDNEIIIGSHCSIKNTSFFIRGNKNKIILGDCVSCYGAEFHIEQDENMIALGNATTVHGRNGYPVHIAADEGTKILIGEDCMLSNGIQIRSTDSHSIIDTEGRRLNPAEDVVIGKHCWLCFGCAILKGVQIADNTVVAAGGICTKQFEESHCVLGGNPAMVLKRNIDWDRKFL